MKSYLSFILALVLLLSNISFAYEAHAAVVGFNPAKDCPNGSCVRGLTSLLEAKIKSARQDRCLPPENHKNQKDWYQSHSLSEKCLKDISELKELNKKLEAISNYLAQKPECQDCLQNKSALSSMMKGEISPFLKVAEAPLCTETAKKEVWKKCDEDAACVFVSTATTFIPSTFVNKLIPSSLGKDGCDGSKDSCLKQMAMGFSKAVFSFFEGMFELLKMAGKGIKSTATDLWEYLEGAEKQSSTAQLSAAVASEEEGFFRQLVNDFPGTMSKVWTGLLAAIKHWMTNSVFCQEWSGQPQFSQCLRPAEGLGCTSCKAMITGVCSLTGTIVSEVIPAFLTGGLFTIAKHGAGAAAKLAKSVRISTESLNKIKQAPIASIANKSLSSVKNSKALLTSSAAAKATLSSMGPLMRALNASLNSLRDAIKSSGAYLMKSPAGIVLIAGAKVAKVSGKVLILPLDNALLRNSFSLGEKTFSKLFKESEKSAKLMRNGVIATETTRGANAVDDALLKLELDPSATNKMAYINAVQKNRSELVENALKSKESLSFKNLQEDYYPELDYGEFSQIVKSDKVELAERELFSMIGKMSDGPQKDQLLHSFETHLSSAARKSALKDKITFNREEVLSNAGLSDAERLEKGMKLIGANDRGLSTERMDKLKRALLEAHEVGEGGVFRYSYSELREKLTLLKKAGLTEKEAELLIRSGLAGKVRPEDSYSTLKKIYIAEVPTETVRAMASSKAYQEIFKEVESARMPSLARALKVLEQDGTSSVAASAIYQRHRAYFNKVQSNSAKNSDAEALLAEFIRKEKRAGKSDTEIDKKLNEAFGACK
jgi:hypothetical protein